MKRHSGFILVEALTSLTISLTIIFMLSLCVSEQFKLINQWEQRVNAHKIILLHLENSHMPNRVTIKNRIYYYQKIGNTYQVRVNNHVYQVKS
ncbi:hypothetical protein [Companilactobacillus bobalius]|uniref:hypothetical protein n=1 Tax=Companilactobacillus bobalius TaxID=2801451 RepID=UPI00117B6F4E|nr:hypothetical protein [Companilactobacillus bobalius]GEO58431.1 hypothetical protein LBO01_15600 [Companilactobacillus paralimentarius]